MKARTNRKHLPPNLSNFLSSFREIGYLCEVAIADILDNSVSAKSTEIKIRRSFFDKYVDKIKEFLDNAE